MTTRIGYLADHPGFVPLLAEWQHREWGHLSPGESSESRAERLRAEARRGGIPTVLVAVEGAALLGAASLVAHDMNGREDLSPWLAAVGVLPDFRRRGVGSALVRAVVDEAARLRVGTLYLYTTSRENESFYRGLGWSVRERVEYLGKRRVIMEIALVARARS